MSTPFIPALRGVCVCVCGLEPRVGAGSTPALWVLHVTQVLDISQPRSMALAQLRSWGKPQIRAPQKTGSRPFQDLFPQQMERPPVPPDLLCAGLKGKRPQPSPQSPLLPDTSWPLGPPGPATFPSSSQKGHQPFSAASFLPPLPSLLLTPPPPAPNPDSFSSEQHADQEVAPGAWRPGPAHPLPSSGPFLLILVLTFYGELSSAPFSADNSLGSLFEDFVQVSDLHPGSTLPPNLLLGPGLALTDFLPPGLLGQSAPETLSTFAISLHAVSPASWSEGPWPPSGSSPAHWALCEAAIPSHTPSNSQVTHRFYAQLALQPPPPASWPLLRNLAAEFPKFLPEISLVDPSRFSLAALLGVLLAPRHPPQAGLVPLLCFSPE